LCRYLHADKLTKRRSTKALILTRAECTLE
jgi:hypothetical protein